MKASSLKKVLSKYKDSKRAETYEWFFKTKKGEYGYQDKFLGITVPVQRSVAREFISLPLEEIEILLESRMHEHRLTSLIIMVDRFKRGDSTEKKRIFDFYLKNKNRVNNWDLVDASAPHIIGEYLINKKRNILFKLARSEVLWDKRIAIVSTYAFIKRGDFEDTISISKILMNDKADLIHKAVGWMLREVGKRDKKKLVEFLNSYNKMMPRTTLRYSIEHFGPSERKKFMKK